MSSDETILAEPSDISPVNIVDEMKSSYLDYAMSVIVSRALPDVRDGLKPVHRRILWACQEGGFVAGKAYRKCAKITGDTMGNYHPHGNQAIYDALARMTQDWSMRVPLIDGQGNFGSMDPDPPAAERYTEARLAKVANALLDDIEKDTVDFIPNYDGSRDEPSVLPARFPNLLVNGAGGIAVGMATNIPPHNLGEVLRACKAYMDNGAITTEELMEIVPAPDFPTGGLILGQSGCRSTYSTGRGSIMMRSRHEIETVRGDRQQIVLTEIPFQVGKAGLVEKIAEAAKDKRIEGISDIRDESNRHGVRVVIELKRDATPDVVLNQLWRHTPAQSSFPANMLAIRGGRPELLNLRDIIESFVRFREETITRRTKYELAKARERAHILLGLVIAVANLDEVVRMIRASANAAAAREALMARDWPIADVAPYLRLIEAIETEGSDGIYRLSDAQVRAILDLRLHRLTALGRDEVGSELQGLATSIEGYLEILGSRARLFEVMREEFDAIEAEFATPRRSTIAPRRRRHRGRGSDRARGDGRHRDHGRLHQAHYARHLPRAESRRQGPCRHGNQGRGRRHGAVRDQHPQSGAVLLDARQGLPHESVAPARRRPGDAWTADGQPAATGGGRDDPDRAAAPRGRGGMGGPACHVRDRQRQCPPQQHGCLRQRALERQDRHEVRRRGR